MTKVNGQSRLRLVIISVITIGALVLGAVRFVVDLLSIATTVTNVAQTGTQEQKIVLWLISWPWWAYWSLTALAVVALAAISITANIRVGADGSPERELRNELAAASKAKIAAEKQLDDALQKLAAPPEPPGGWRPFKAETPLEDAGKTAIHIVENRVQSFKLRQGGFRTIHWSGLQLRIDHLGLMNRLSPAYGNAVRIKAVLQTENGMHLSLVVGSSVIRDQEQNVFVVPMDEHNVFLWNAADRSLSHFSLQGEKNEHGVAFALRVPTINSMNAEISIEGYFADWGMSHQVNG